MSRDTVEDMKKIQDVLRRHPKPDLVINRCMGDTAERFKEWAESDFGNDYGAAFKLLWDMYFPQNMAILEKINELDERVTRMEVAKELPPAEKPEPKKVVKFLDGSKRRIGGD